MFAHRTISTHTPLTGCNSNARGRAALRSFLLTHPSRGATLCPEPPEKTGGFLLTHPSRGATQTATNAAKAQAFLLTHPSRGATSTSSSCLHTAQFLLTHPSRGATRFTCAAGPGKTFLLTHPSRGATGSPVAMVRPPKISTHTPLTGCNRKIMYFTANCTPYNVGVDFFKNLY